jgi:hypothetical protein
MMAPFDLLAARENTPRAPAFARGTLRRHAGSAAAGRGGGEGEETAEDEDEYEDEYERNGPETAEDHCHWLLLFS